MNNDVITNLNLNNRNVPKFVSFLINNRKLIRFWFLLIFGLLFVVGFALYLFSGIGMPAENINYTAGGPSRNGVWYVESFINKTINGQYINDWDQLQYAFNSSGKGALNDFFNMAYTLHTINVAVLPIWIVGIVFIGVYLISILIMKLLKKLLMKKLSNSLNIPINSNQKTKNIEQQNTEIKIENENLNLGSLNEDILDIIKNATSNEQTKNNDVDNKPNNDEEKQETK